MAWRDKIKTKTFLSNWSYFPKNMVLMIKEKALQDGKVFI